MATQRPSLSYQALILLLALLMVSVAVVSLNGFWRLHTSLPQILLYGAAAVIFSWLFWRLPQAAVALWVVGLAGVLIAGRYSHPLSLYLSDVSTQIYDLWHRLSLFELETTFGPALGDLFLAGSALGFAFVIVNEALASGRAFWAIAIGTLAMGTEWSWNYDKSASDFILYATAAFALWVLAQAGHRDASWLSTGRKASYRSQVSLPIVVVLLTAILAGVLPSDLEPVDLGEIGAKAQEVIPALQRMRGGQGIGTDGRFSLRATGFSPVLGTLGGPAQLDHAVALQASVGTPLGTTTYLRGVASAVYTGTTWLPGDTGQVKIPPDGNLATDYGPDIPREYFTVGITPALPFGKTIFSLLEPMRVDGLKSTYTADGSGNLLSQAIISTGAAYRTTARVPLYSADQIRLLSTATSDSKYKEYLQLPASIPTRVRSLAIRLTQAQEHPLDKALALESYLRTMPYELNVPAPRGGADFVDFFLFDLKRGYCVYYATALAVMLRDLGIPSRFVEGFAIPASAEFSFTSDGTRVYTVRNSDAHAWVEAYFPGYGWITMDPTPRSDLPIIDRSRPLPPASGLTPGTDGSETPDSPDLTNPEKSASREQNNPEGGGALVVDLATRPWPWALMLTCGFAGLILLAYRRLRLQNRMAASHDREAVQEAWNKSTWLMQCFDFVWRPYQTALEYARTLSKSWPEMSESIHEVASAYTKVRYGPPEQSVSPDAPTKARRLWEAVQQSLLARYGWRLYLWRRLRPGKK